jgi:FkbM family methyltransferase
MGRHSAAAGHKDKKDASMEPLCPTKRTGGIARWAVRASKGKALLDGRLKGLRGKITSDVSILLPLAAHAHYWSGLHEDGKSLLFLSEMLPPNGVLFDVGANIGVYLSALYALNGPELKLVGFEPIPTTLALLQQTLDLNGVPARIEPLALSSKEGELRLTAYSRGMNNFWLKGEASDHPSMSVRTRPLDLWLSEHPALTPDAIKIDVEGHELEVLEGAVRLLAGRRPALMVECHGAAWDGLGVSRARFGQLLKDAGYRNLRFSNGEPADFFSLRTTVHLFAS